MSAFEDGTEPWAPYAGASTRLCVAQAVYVVTDCFVYQLIVCCDAGNKSEVLGEQSTLIWGLWNLCLCQICGPWSEIDASFMLYSRYSRVKWLGDIIQQHIIQECLKLTQFNPPAF